MDFLKRLFKKQDEIDKDNMPQHIAIIMDGNGRWAQKRGLPRSAGHRAGADNLTKITEECANLGIKYLTVYAFSTENWKRPQKEVDYLFDLFIEYIDKFKKDERNKDVKLKVIGDISKLPENLQKEIIEVQKNTNNNKKLELILALNYGGRDEIHNAIKLMFKEYNNSIEDINEDTFKKYLYTKDIPDPELIIRPSGEMRLSNFLLYQCAYSEFWFANINWPDFKKEHLLQAICDYQNRNRRFGGI